MTDVQCKKPSSILIVDDEKDICFILDSVATEIFDEVLLASDGTAAVEMLQQRVFDVYEDERL